MAVTVTPADLGNYRRVLTEGTGDITLAEIYASLYATAGGAETYMTRTGSAGAYVYTVLRATDDYAYFYVNHTGECILEEGDILEVEWRAGFTTTATNFVVGPNSTLRRKAGSKVNLDIGGVSSPRNQVFLYGCMISEGTEANPCEFTGFTYLYPYMFTTIPWDLNWDTIGNFGWDALANGTMRFIGAADEYRNKGYGVAHSFKHVTFQGRPSTMRGIFYLYNDVSKWTFEDCTFKNFYIMYHYWASVNFKRCTFANNYEYYRTYNCGNEQAATHYSSTLIDGAGYNYKSNQKFLAYDECTFDALNDAGTGSPNYAPDGTGVRALLPMGGSIMLVKNGTFKNMTTSPMQSYASIFILYGTQTYENCPSTQTWSDSGTFLHARMLTLTVNKPDGTPLENASVMIRQKENHEIWTFTTDSNGKVLRADGLGIFLIEKEQTAASTYVQWSDGTGDKLHEITVSHPDYATHTEDIAMTEDKTRTITMSAKSGTKIYNSTVYNSKIY